MSLSDDAVTGYQWHEPPRLACTPPPCPPWQEEAFAIIHADGYADLIRPYIEAHVKAQIQKIQTSEREFAHLFWGVHL